MSKVESLETISNIGGNPASAAATVNTNMQRIETAFENTLSRDGSTPNEMLAVLDMNSFRIINLADGVEPQDGVTVSQLEGLIASGILDGNKGDITVSGGGASFSINAGVVTTIELGGDITTAGKNLLDDPDTATQRATLGLGSAATHAHTDYALALHSHDVADVLDFTEAVQDVIASYLTAGTNVTFTVAAFPPGSLTINASGGGGGGIGEAPIDGTPYSRQDAGWVAASTGGGVTDHGALTGLGDDDHPQYALITDLADVAFSGDYADLTGTPTIVTDHGALTGLGDDDHTQYHNDTRGDIRYHTKTVQNATDAAQDAALATHAALTSGTHGISAFAATFLDDANAADVRTTLGLATVAATGAYADLSGTPTIPADLSAVTFIVTSASALTSAERVLTAGTNITLDTSVAGLMTINASGGGGSGTVTNIASGAGLTGGPITTTGTLDVGAGTGITVNANDVAIDQTFSPSWSGTHTFAIGPIVSGATLAGLTFVDGDGAADSKAYHIRDNSGAFSIYATTDAAPTSVAGATLAMQIIRTGLTLDSFTLNGTLLQHGTNEIWDQGNIAARIAALTDETSLDTTADTLVIRDSSASAAREVLLSDLLKYAAPGSLQYVTSTILGSANANLTLSGLDLDAHGTYIVITKLKNSAATTATLSMFYNSDTTTTNYNTSIASNGASTQANNASIGSLFNSTDSTVGHNFTISRIGTRVTAGSNVALASNSSSNIRAGTVTHEWKTASTNVTGITFNCGASTFDTGSSVFVYRLMQGGSGSDVRKFGSYANSDVSRNTTTTLTDDPVLQANLLAGKKYKITMLFAVDSSPTPDFKYDLNYTGTMASGLYRRQYAVYTTANLATGDPGTSGNPHLASALNVATTFTVGATDTLYIELTATCETTTAGVFSLRWAQGTSSGTNITRRRNANIEVTEFT